MKKYSITITLIFAIFSIISFANIAPKETLKVSSSPRDYSYESYCDSIYENDTDYFLDVIAESDKYQQYIEEHREYWKEYDCYKETH